MFDFKLIHVPGSGTQGPGGLSRRRRAQEDDEDNEEDSEDVEDWLDEVSGCGVWVANGIDKGRIGIEGWMGKGEGRNGKDEGKKGTEEGKDGRDGEQREGRMVLATSTSDTAGTTDGDIAIPDNDDTARRDNDLLLIKQFLETLSIPAAITDAQ
ncbi:hypothetical protein HYDPIDRAFT_190683, partial [Hydnomerulius pinastri MD-312]